MIFFITLYFSLVFGYIWRNESTQYFSQWILENFTQLLNFWTNIVNSDQDGQTKAFIGLTLLQMLLL